MKVADNLLTSNASFCFFSFIQGGHGPREDHLDTLLAFRYFGIDFMRRVMQGLPAFRAPHA
jgi:hypothetical protein